VPFPEIITPSWLASPVGLSGVFRLVDVHSGPLPRLKLDEATSVATDRTSTRSDNLTHFNVLEAEDLR
jgi:hypothetical protein